MTSEPGHFALGLALCVSLIHTATPFAAGGGTERRLGIVRAGARIHRGLAARAQHGGEFGAQLRQPRYEARAHGLHAQSPS